MEIIKLEARDRSNNYLEHKKDNDYILRCQYTYRIGFKDDINDLTFVDPSGGPFMEIGTPIGDRVVKAIKRDNNNQIIIELNDLSGN